MKIIDLRSDTVTRPTDAMRKAMFNAEVGDVVMGDDPTVNDLERMGAELFGKESCLFTASGTMSNQVAVLSLCNSGEQIIVHNKSHMYNLEVAGLGRVCGVQPRPIEAVNGEYNLKDLEENIIQPAIQTAPTTLICIENTFDLNKGLVVSKKHIDDVCKLAHKYGIPVYMDGARVLNAAIALGISPKKLCENVDMVSVCLSKGLGCPIGALLAGNKKDIEKAKFMRQMLGGGWRQGGVIAAAGIVALKNLNRLSEDHEKAQNLGKKLKALGFGVDLNQVQTNIINIDLSSFDIEAKAFCQILSKFNVKAKPIGLNNIRMITHMDVTFEELDRVEEAVKATIKELDFYRYKD